MPHIYVIELGKHRLRQLSKPMLSIGLLGTNFTENFIKTKKKSIHENAPENIVYEMSATLSRGRWVNIE